MTEKKSARKSTELGPQVYLGPNIQGGRLLQSTVFRTEVPQYLHPLLESQPAVAELIVPVQDMAAVQARIKTAGTAENVAYNQILKEGLNHDV
ncbi:hypothetical protein [Paenibacillus contaminans]|uniref:Uncharacterized protein n=1 Tax=Paenibacillus contaminans TaxID=450362 RepID=A0A329MFY2_9BACL|nr:hypothetical protein [Paenibacillus contaminans]RAV18829.1 hypothetical protein DQG23_24170 [Paenibacillus contaminans]